MKKLLSLIPTLWVPVVLFVMGLLLYRFGVGILIWILSFFIMPIVVLVHAKRKIDTKMGVLALCAIIIPVVAVFLNFRYEFLCGPEPDALMVYYREAIELGQLEAMIKVLAIAEPLAFLFLLRDRPLWTIVACLLDILIWLLGIYMLLSLWIFPHSIEIY